MADLSIDQAIACGIELAKAGHHPDAIGMFRAVLLHDPDHFRANIHIGNSLFAEHRDHEAFYFLWRAKQLDPNEPSALMNFGMILSHLGHLEDGLGDMKKAIAIAERRDPDPASLAMYYSNLGVTYEWLERHEEAAQVLARGIALDPTDAFPRHNLGVCLLRLNRHRDAIVEFEKALQLADQQQDATSRLNSSDVHYNMGLAYLALGELRKGFEHYEYRHTSSGSHVHHEVNLNLPAELQWKPGVNLEGKRLLVRGEQGIGDAIHMLRYYPRIEPRFKTKEVMVIEPKVVRPLVSKTVTVLNPGESLVDRYDYWIGRMSLPLLFDCEMPPPLPLMHRSERLSHWRNEIKTHFPFGMTVGVCWAGGFKHKNDHHRSIPLKKFATLFDVPVNFVSVQQIRETDMAEFAGLLDKYPNLKALYFDDLRDTAAAMAHFDAVISVDTSVAHLAGNQGIKTAVLIPKFNTDWRWQLGREDSPWYPTMALYRQPEVGDWDTPLARLKKDLWQIISSALLTSS